METPPLNTITLTTAVVRNFPTHLKTITLVRPFFPRAEGAMCVKWVSVLEGLGVDCGGDLIVVKFIAFEKILNLLEN